MTRVLLPVVHMACDIYLLLWSVLFARHVQLVCRYWSIITFPGLFIASPYASLYVRKMSVCGKYSRLVHGQLTCRIVPSLLLPTTSFLQSLSLLSPWRIYRTSLNGDHLFKKKTRNLSWEANIHEVDILLFYFIEYSKASVYWEYSLEFQFESIKDETHFP